MVHMAGLFLTSYEAKANVKLSDPNVMAFTFAPFHITSQKSNSDVKIYYRNLE